MAVVNVYDALHYMDYSNISGGGLGRHWAYWQVEDGFAARTNAVLTADVEIDGAAYASAYFVYWQEDKPWTELTEFRAVFGGVGLVEGDDGLVGGTWTGIHVQAYGDGAWQTLHSITGFSRSGGLVSDGSIWNYEWMAKYWLLDGNDELFLSDGDDTATGFAGEDRLFGQKGDDHLFGEDGDDLLRGGRGVDVLDGGTGADRLKGEGGNDHLDGGSGDDLLYGQRGNDVMLGRDGADVFFAGAGRDTMRAGADTDVDRFVFLEARDSLSGARDRITGFDPGEDLLDFRGFDGDVGTAGHQAVAVSADGPTAHGLWVVETRKGVRVKIDDDGDARADFAVDLFKVDGLDGTDFLLS